MSETKEKAPNSAAYYVQDACGDKFLYTLAGLDYEAAFRKHAAWWIRYSTRPGAHKDTDVHGNRLRQPVRPTKVVIEPYYDKSSP